MGPILIFLSILPVFLLGQYIYNNDFEKEPKGLLISLFLMGIGSTAITLGVSYVMDQTIPFFSTDNAENLNIFTLIPYVFIGVALIEEFSKWFFVYVIGYHNKEFNHAYDAIVYSTFVALGFACIENIIYVLTGGLSTAVVRAITAVPGHACFGVIMGYHLGMAKTADKHKNKELSKKHKWKSLFYPILFHGIYDYLVYGATMASPFTILFVIFVCFLFNEVPKKVRQLASVHYDIAENAYNAPVVATRYQTTYRYLFCPICGEKVIGKFCPKCGHNHLENTEGNN